MLRSGALLFGEDLFLNLIVLAMLGISRNRVIGIVVAEKYRHLHWRQSVLPTKA